MSEKTPFDDITVNDIAECVKANLNEGFRQLRRMHGNGMITAKLVLEMEAAQPMTTVSHSIILCTETCVNKEAS